MCNRSCELNKINIMNKIERKLEESYKSLRVQYRFTERENENFMILMQELKSELKQLRLHVVVKSFSAEQVVNELKENETLDDAIIYFDNLK